MSDVTSTADPAPTGLPETSAGAVVDHREYDATVDAGYEGEDVPDPDSPIKFQFSWRKLWRVRAWLLVARAREAQNAWRAFCSDASVSAGRSMREIRWRVR